MTLSEFERVKAELEIKDLRFKTSIFARMLPWSIAIFSFLGIVWQLQSASISRERNELAIEKLEVQKEVLSSDVEVFEVRKKYLIGNSGMIIRLVDELDEMSDLFAGIAPAGNSISRPVGLTHKEILFLTRFKPRVELLRSKVENIDRLLNSPPPPKLIDLTAGLPVGIAETAPATPRLPAAAESQSLPETEDAPMAH